MRTTGSIVIIILSIWFNFLYSINYYLLEPITSTYCMDSVFIYVLNNKHYNGVYIILKNSLQRGGLTRIGPVSRWAYLPLPLRVTTFCCLYRKVLPQSLFTATKLDFHQCFTVDIMKQS